MQPEMTLERAKNITQNALLVFVLVPVGFAPGKEVTARRPTATIATVPAAPAGDKCQGLSCGLAAFVFMNPVNLVAVVAATDGSTSR